MKLFSDVNPDQWRNEQAQRNRRIYAKPRPPTLITEHEATPRLKVQRPNQQGKRADLAERRTLAVARYTELRAGGLSAAEAKQRVAGEFGAALRSVTDWVKGHR